MPFIGNTPDVNFTSFAKQDLTGVTGSPAKRGYTLTHAVANANEIEVFVNNVRQEPTDAYTVNGTGLTMTGDVETTDDFYIIYLGKAIQTTVPPDGSVSTAKIASSAVDLTSKVTGVLPVANGGTGLSSAITTPYFKLTKNGGQSTPNGATVTVTWQNTIYDTSSIVSISNDRVIITSATAGLYFVGASVETNILNFRQIIGLRKNGSALARSEVATQTVANNGSRAPTINVHTIIEMANTDYLDVTYISVNGTNTIQLNPAGTYFYGWRIA